MSAATPDGSAPDGRDAPPRHGSAGAGAVLDRLARSDRGRSRAFVREQLAAVDLDGRSVCVIVPDGTRSCPLPLLLDAVHGALHGRVRRLTVLVALGTHARDGRRRPSARPAAPAAGRFPGTTVLNHAWWDPTTFVDVGTIGADRIAELSGGHARRRPSTCGSTAPSSSTT